MIENNLQARIKTSFVLLTIIILIFLFNYFLLFCLIVFGCFSLIEFFNISKKIVKSNLLDDIQLMDLVHDNRSDYIKITVDSPNDITIDKTSYIARRIKNDENIISMFPNGCRLEVGTPGIGSNLNHSFQHLDRVDKFKPFNPNNCNLGRNMFNNHTRQQTKNL